MPKVNFNINPYQYIKTVLVFLILCISHYGYGQDDCECKSGEKITVCYYSTNKFCPPDDECRYTLDGDFMINSLTEKLQNPSLFGPQGISKCPIVLEQVEDVNTVEYLEQKECDIMFVGVFTDIVGGSFVPTSIPQSDLNTIKAWSTKCPSNLTIVTQVEAAPWGYEFEDLNRNPNRPDPNFTDFSIFNGTFGQISSFNQGGSFQGIFTDFPSTGYSILARDFNNEPTIVLDSLTNDIILGDIGILCEIAGPMSDGPDIENDSDILACNIFDLGCKIATNSTTEFVSICNGDSYTTSTGQVLFNEGVYVDSLLNIEGCDSLIYTLLDVNDLYDTNYSERICDDYEYAIIVGSSLYNTNNRSGTELLESQDGCDSTVYIELYYFSSDTTYLVESICQNDTFFVDNVPFTETTSTVVPLQNQDQCDSLVYLELVKHDIYDLESKVDLCPGEVYNTPQGGTIADDSIYTVFLLSEFGCDSIHTVIIETHESYQQSETYIGCQGDGYNLIIGNTTYGETNPVGTEILQSIVGCDSIIEIDFTYNKLDTSFVIESICEGDTFLVGGFPFMQTEQVEVVLQNSNFCDSTIHLDLLVNEVYNTQVEVGLCPGEVYETADGVIISETSIYNEFLTSEFGCDSTNTLIITSYENQETDETYLGCQGDGYNINIGGTDYNESNPAGSEMLQSIHGCDSLVQISFVYQPLDTTYLDIQLCPYETFEVGGIEYAGNLYETIILPSSKDCDSIIFLDLETFESEEIALQPSYDINLNDTFSFGIPSLDGSYYEWIADGQLLCDTCPEPGLSIDGLPTFLQLNYTDEYECFYSSETEVTYRCTPFFSNVIHINSTTEENRQFKVKALCPFEGYSLNIFDRWGALVFTSSDQEEFWDGFYNGNSVAQGVYIYQMRYIRKGLAQQVIGSLTVLD